MHGLSVCVPTGILTINVRLPHVIGCIRLWLNQICAGDGRQRRRMVASMGRLASQPPRSRNIFRPAFRDVGYVRLPASVTLRGLS